MTRRTLTKCAVCGKDGLSVELPLRGLPLCSMSCKATWDAQHPVRRKRPKAPVEQPQPSLFDPFKDDGGDP
jgi:hypothetical protein